MLWWLFEWGDEAGDKLDSDILTVLGINEYGNLVGQEAMEAG